MSLAALQRDPLTACVYARESESGLYSIEFEGAKMASSWAVKFHRRAGKAAGEWNDYLISREGPRVTVRYLPKAPGIVQAG